ncbi:hypothetical protein [Brachyspira pilosicoli]|uniref:family 4 glycosyl hydrolase n=1 Tax=Brachyspira pilosicoli TaxID=52584 RepID=UPI001CA4C1FF|nr:hypothetical protein [Brachyspira pilosicoli]MBW5397502.1 glycoside hydrolase [Brachyspira pilosicoli]
MKLTVLGGGGVRSPFLAKSLALQVNKIGVTSVVFMDNNDKKLQIYGNLSKEIFEKLNNKVKFSITSDPIEALKDADYIITTIRVGEEEGRVKDERVALKNGVLGQETTGPGGFSFSIRSIPVILDYCKMIEKYSSKDAILFNFTNPSGLVTQAIQKSGFSKKFFGICDAPSELIREICHIIGEKEENVKIDCFGLNHLSWFRNIQVNGKDITKSIIENPKIYKETEMRYFDVDLVHLSDDMLLNEYLYFYYYREKAVQAIVDSGKTRGEQILEINNKMYNALKDIDIHNDLDKAFEIYFSYLIERESSYMARESGVEKSNKREVIPLSEFLKLPDSGGYAGVAIDILEAASNNHNKRVVVSVKNNGALEFLDDNDVVEISCTIDENGNAVPIKMNNIPKMQENLIKDVKLYENLTVEAIFEKSIQKAIKALTVHPLVNSYSIAKSIVFDYLEVHKEYFKDWK